MNVQEELLNTTIDPALTGAALSDLCSRALGAGVRAGGYRVLTGGCWNRVVAVSFEPGEPGGSGEAPSGTGGELVFKISPHREDPRIIREYRVLEVFAEQTAMPVPRPLLLDSSAETIPGTVLVMTMIPGEVMHQCFGLLGRADRERIIKQIADYVVELHRHRSGRFGGVEKPEEERDERWADFWLPRFDKAIEDVASAGIVDTKLLDRVSELRKGFPKALDIGSSAVLTHYDIWSGNVMVDTAVSPAAVSGFIDIPGFYADYARELSFMMMFGVADQRFFERYLNDHSLDPGFELRVNIYNLKMHLKHVVMYPSEGYYRDGANACMRFIEEHG